ncbi:uncharacterized protein LOC143305643 [Osmia lignaria lignaria]|uniref:uncharacterized protein LOC143305643 n=1 Tax=Osmia lignaria lignaria TaxID=1437193 RepID=UPI00402B0C90
MWTLRTACLLITLTMVASQKYFHRPVNDLSTGERFLSDLHVVTREVQESALLQKKTMVDAMTAVSKATFGVLGDLKRSNSGIVSTLVDIEMAKLEAIKAAKRVLLNMLASQIASLMEEISNEDIIELVQSPPFNHLVDLLLPLLSGSSKMMDTVNINNIRAQQNPETAATREYSSRDTTSSMQRPSSTTSFPLSRESPSLQSVKNFSKL